MSNDGAITTVANWSATVNDGNGSMVILRNGNDVLVAGTNSLVGNVPGRSDNTTRANGIFVAGNCNDPPTFGASSILVGGRAVSGRARRAGR